MLGRFINFLLVIPHTKYLNTVGSYGDITAIFSFMAFFNIILTYGMDTAYFNFVRNGHEPRKIYAISQKSIMITTLVFSGTVLLFVDQSAALLGFTGHADYVYSCLIFLAFDTLSVMPYAKLRFEEKPLRFAGIKLANILVNVALNLLFLQNTPDFLAGYSQVTLILIANAVASISSFLLLSPMAFDIRFSLDKKLLGDMLHYAWPLIFVGLAGMVNETLSRNLLHRLLPGTEGSYQNGIFGAFYKLTMVMTMFVQAFRFAAMPFFFKQKESEENRGVYANVMYWFISVCSLIFLASMSFIDELAHLFIKNPDYFKDPRGLFVVPILLLANLALGIYYNLSIWYQLTNKTRAGAVIAVGGAVATIVLNIALIPEYGFVASAWITLAVYGSMCIAGYLLGQHYYRVPYNVVNYLLLIAASIVLWLIEDKWLGNVVNRTLAFTVKAAFPLLFLLIIWMLQPKRKIA